LDDLAEFDLQSARQLDAVLGLQQVRDAALADWLLTRITAS
jgi:hypothetical protein